MQKEIERSDDSAKTVSSSASESLESNEASAGCQQTATGWLGGWISSAKEKSSEAWEFMKKDLAEFTTTVKTDAEKTASQLKNQLNQENATVASEKVKKGVSNLFGSISSVLTIPPDDSDQEKFTVPNTDPFDRYKSRLHNIQIDQNTYLTNPDKIDAYHQWLEKFDLETSKGDISELLVVNVKVRSLYTQLVPSQVSHTDFWHRYFFKIHDLKEEEIRKVALMKRADTITKDLAWEDDFDEDHTESQTLEKSKNSSNISDTNDQTSLAQPFIQSFEESHLSQCNNENSIQDNLSQVTKTEIPLEENSTSHVAQSNQTLSTIEPMIINNQEENSTSLEDSKHKRNNSNSDTAQTTNSSIQIKAVLEIEDTSASISSQNSPSTNSKESTSLDDDWERDFDDMPDVTDETTIKPTADATQINTESKDEEWENWE